MKSRTKKRKAKRPNWRLRLVIDRGTDYPESDGYNVDNSKPWPLGIYATEEKAMEARNCLVITKQMP